MQVKRSQARASNPSAGLQQARLDVAVANPEWSRLLDAVSVVPTANLDVLPDHAMARISAVLRSSLQTSQLTAYGVAMCSVGLHQI